MLTEFELRNFKCFEALKLRLAPLTLLCGLNGMGKSSLMQALLLLRQSQLAGELNRGRLVLGGQFVDLGTDQDILFEDATSGSIEFSLRHSDISEPLNLGIPYLEGGGERVLGGEILAAIRDHAPPGDASIEVESVADGTVVPFQMQVTPEWENIPPFGGRVMYVNAERVGPRKLHPRSEELARRGDIGTRGDYALNYLTSIQDEWLTKNDPRCKLSRSRRLLSIVEHWLQEVSPGAHLRLETVPDADAIIAGFSFDRPNDIETRRYRSTNVGFGLSYIIPVLVALLEPKDSLCLIENPEAHLHPRGQTRLAELAVRASLAGVQVIVETHSDHFLDGVRIAVREAIVTPDKIAIHYFQREGTRARVSSPLIDISGRLSFWPEGFFDQHEENLSRLLAPRF